MTFALLTPFATLTNADNILTAYPIFYLKEKKTILADFQPDITVTEELDISVTVRIVISEELASLFMKIGVEVFEMSEEPDDEEDDEDEEDAVKPARGRGRKAAPEPEPEPEEGDVTYYVEYETSVRHTSMDEVSLVETDAYKRKMRKENLANKIQGKLALYTMELAQLNTPAPPFAVVEDESGMGAPPNITDAALQYQKHLAFAQEEKSTRGRQSILTLLSWFEMNVLGVKAPAEGEEDDEVEEIPMNEIALYLSEQEYASFMERLRDEMQNIIDVR